MVAGCLLGTSCSHQEWLAVLQTYHVMAVVSVKQKRRDRACLPLAPLCITHRGLKQYGTQEPKRFLRTQQNYVIIKTWTVKASVSQY